MLSVGKACTVFLALHLVKADLQKQELHLDELPVIQGTPTCDSNCTYVSSRNNKLMTCKIQDCITLKYERKDYSLPPDITSVSLTNFTDSVSGEVKEALRITWSPAEYNALNYTTGYLINITDGTSSYLKCYFLGQKMDFNSNKKDIFHNDCYILRTKSKSFCSIHVSVSSLPLRANDADYTRAVVVIKAPYSNSSKFFGTLSQDKVEKRGRKSLMGTVDEVYCQNASIKYSYAVNQQFGRRASVTVGEGEENGGCSINETAYDDLNPIGILYNLSFPNPKSTYRITLRGSEVTDQVNITYITFKTCTKANERWNLKLIAVIVTACVLGLIGTGTSLLICGKRRNFKNKNKNADHLYEVAPSDETDGISTHDNEALVNTIPPVPSSVKVFVAFMESHKLHTEVVKSFCSFLRSVLAVDVSTHLGDKEYPHNIVSYTIKHLENADKVVLICSEEVEGDLEQKGVFSLAAQYVRNQTFAGNKPEKFLICHFSYTCAEHTTIHANDLASIRVYKLMEDFEEFYFDLIGYEKYQKQGLICRFREIEPGSHLSPSARECRDNLEKSIRNMTRFVAHNPTWYKDAHRQDVDVLTFERQEVRQRQRLELCNEQDTMAQFNEDSRPRASTRNGIHSADIDLAGSDVGFVGASLSEG